MPRKKDLTVKTNIIKKTWLNKINRHQPDKIDREKFLRLDKNERVIKFEKRFIKYLKKKINTFNISAYPDTNRIKKMISKKNKISPKMIYISAGSDLSIKTCFELFTKPKDKVIILEPTFGMVNVYCDVYNLKTIKIGYDKNLNLDLNKLLNNISKSISLVIIANPNSPTGTIIEKTQMIKIINKCNNSKVPIIIDEAYEGFYNFTYASYIKRFKNLIVTRTFSKSFGLAGLRAGYAISNQKIAELMNKYRPMYEINSIVCLAIEFLIKNYSIVDKHIKEIFLAKKYLKQELKKMKIDFIDTYANFFHIRIKKKANFEKFLKRKGILVRSGPGVRGLEDYLRFSLGSKIQMKKIIKLIN
jgi:histidinol-phosphate aminotransferase